MQRTLINCLLICLVSSAGIARGGFGDPEPLQYKVFLGGNQQDEVRLESKCPKTMIVGTIQDCLKCHVQGQFFTIKESPPDATREYPIRGMRVLDGILYFDLYGIDDATTIAAREISLYLTWHPKIKEVVINIFSEGGNLFSAMDIRGTMTRWRAQGIKVRTEVPGYAGSAGFLIFVSGSVGSRFVDADAYLMWHEIQSFEYPGMKSGSDQAEKARVTTLLQSSTNDYLSIKSKLTKAQIDEKIKNQEFWMTGTEAVASGFADGLLSGPIASATTIPATAVIPGTTTVQNATK